MAAKCSHQDAFNLADELFHRVDDPPTTVVGKSDEKENSLDADKSQEKGSSKGRSCGKGKSSSGKGASVGGEGLDKNQSAQIAVMLKDQLDKVQKNLGSYVDKALSEKLEYRGKCSLHDQENSLLPKRPCFQAEAPSAHNPLDYELFSDSEKRRVQQRGQRRLVG